MLTNNFGQKNHYVVGSLAEGGGKSNLDGFKTDEIKSNYQGLGSSIWHYSKISIIIIYINKYMVQIIYANCLCAYTS